MTTGATLFISNEDAVEAILNQSFRVDDREIVHCYRRFIGADWDVIDALKLIHDAENVVCFFFKFSLNGKFCLHIEADGNLYVFDDITSQEVI
jgi:hypothetical protein